MSKMKKVTSGVKGVLNQRVRLGLFSVPLWVVGLVVVAQGGAGPPPRAALRLKGHFPLLRSGIHLSYLPSP